MRVPLAPDALIMGGRKEALDEAEIVRICAHLADLNSTLNIRVVPSGR